MIINGIELKKYDENYYVSKFGDVYSLYSKKFLKHYIDHDGYHRVDIHRKHIKVHKLVYQVWKSKVIFGECIRHIDDDKDNNCIYNLIIGTQQENIQDCIKNGNRLGNYKSITVFDKKENRQITFPSIKHLIEYDGHSNKSNSLYKYMKSKWFKERYDVISVENVETIENYELLKKQYIASRVGLENATNPKRTEL